MEGNEVTKDICKAQKRARKEKKERKKIEKRIKKMKEKSVTPENERGNADAEGRWDDRKKKLTYYEGIDVSF